MGYIQSSFESAKDSFNKTVEDISSKDLLTSGKEFIASNDSDKVGIFSTYSNLFLILMNLGIF